MGATAGVQADAERDIGALRRAEWAETFTPPPRFTVSAWADAQRMLSREASAEPGRWRTDRAPYLRGIMDAFSEPGIEEVVFMKASQLGATEILNNVVGYHIDQDPAPILVLQPNVKPMAEAWSKDRLAPMLRDTPALAGKVRDPRSRDSGNTVTHKEFDGGHITVAGANSAAGLASRPIRVLLCDEIDRYPVSAGSEGDPILLSEKRAATFWNRKIAKFSTPTLKHVSRIEHDFERGDRRRYYVPCPGCQTMQLLRFRDPDGTYRLLFQRDAEGSVQPATVGYLCVHCGIVIPEHEKQWMLAHGEWRAERPTTRVASFHLNALYSPWRRWAEIAQTFVDAKDNPELLQVFVNTDLAETWELQGEQITAEGLQARAEVYAAEVPRGAALLTAGVDVHADRLELEIDGWGAGEESWTIGHWRLHGDTAHEEVWHRLEGYLARAYQHEGGTELRIRACMIDSGYRTTEVYRFVRLRQVRNVWASKGTDERGRPPVTRASRPNRDGVKLWTIGTIAMKDTLFARLKVILPGPRYVHFPQPPATTDDALASMGLDAEYFAQFAAEKVVLERGRGGRPVRKYIQIRPRNEAIDLKVLALAALHALGPRVREQLSQRAEQAREGAQAAETAAADAPAEPTETEATSPRPAPPRRRGFVHRWRDS